MSMQAPDDFREHLYTIDTKGNRLWVYPQVVQGFYRNRRIIAALFLIALYIGLPWITIGGKQAVLLDLMAREFTLFGLTFFASDTEFLVVILGAVGFSLFFFTAVLGRVWCGWACPETVFLEFIFRPIETLCEGRASTRRQNDSKPLTVSRFLRKSCKWGLFAVVAWVLATTALTYFVGRSAMWPIITGHPALHPTLFTITLFVMFGLLFQFGWFREQFCTIVCPYARFQSVLMDSRSLIVGYNTARGEPRGKKGEGDCIDCKLCIRVCPTGIDIRNGLQLECIQCTACADACDSIMDSLKRERGLIGYTTEDKLAGKPHGFFRPRVIIYAGILTIYAIIFSVMLYTKPTAEIRFLRKFAGASPYSLTPQGKVMNHLDAHITNKSKHEQTFRAVPSKDPAVSIISPLPEIKVLPGGFAHLPIFLVFSKDTHPTAIEVSVASETGAIVSEQILLTGPDQ